MPSLPEVCAPVHARTLFEAALDQALHTLCETMSAQLNALLVAIVSHVVGRPHHVRQMQVQKRLRRGGTYCRCGSNESRRFSRNEFRSRQPMATH